MTGAPLPEATELVWQQGLLDVLLEYPIESDRSSFSIRPALARLGQQTTTVLRFLPPTGGERAYQFSGDPGLVQLDPRWHHTALRFVRLGFRHILDGIDHLLFLLCLVIPFRRFRPLIAVITSFTVAHSITLIASTLGLAPTALWFAPLIETLIALSILYMAFENIVGARLERRWMLAFGFGLVHGFGFSFFLRDSLQFAGANLAASLLAFNVGVELGRSCVVAAAVPVLGWLFRRIPERIGTILLSALVAHSAWHWMAERGATLRQYRFEWPALDLALAADVMRALMLVLIVAGAAWLMLGLARRLAQTARREEAGSRLMVLVACALAVPAALAAQQGGTGLHPLHAERRLYRRPGDQRERSLRDALCELSFRGDPYRSGVHREVGRPSLLGPLQLRARIDAQERTGEPQLSGIRHRTRLHPQNERHAGRSGRRSRRIPPRSQISVSISSRPVILPARGPHDVAASGPCAFDPRR